MAYNKKPPQLLAGVQYGTVETRYQLGQSNPHCGLLIPVDCFSIVGQLHEDCSLVVTDLIGIVSFALLVSIPYVGEFRCT